MSTGGEVRRLEPDVVLKLRVATEQNVRLVGELKSCVTVPLGKAMQEAVGDNTAEAREILAQIIRYMLGHRLRYGFMSSYEDTIFLKIDIYFSDTYQHSRVFTDGTNKPSVRMGILYLLCKSTVPDNGWLLSDHLAKINKTLKTKLTASKGEGFRELSTPHPLSSDIRIIPAALVGDLSRKFESVLNITPREPRSDPAVAFADVPTQRNVDRQVLRKAHAKTVGVDKDAGEEDERPRYHFRHLPSRH